MPYIRESWRRDPLSYARSWLEEIAPRHARKKGTTQVGDALEIAENLGPTDLAIIDPPYSDVQYSRFYHVLEAIARTEVEIYGEVSGVGRYPSIEDRPQSEFSLKSKSESAMEDLLQSLAAAGSQALITFPKADCSNGLSGERIAKLAKEYFQVRTKTVNGRFSTLGGNNTTRAARQSSAELIIALKPLP
jgi:adenine-specific DNA methylase